MPLLLFSGTKDKVDAYRKGYEHLKKHNDVEFHYEVYKMIEDYGKREYNGSSEEITATNNIISICGYIVENFKDVNPITAHMVLEFICDKAQVDEEITKN